MLRGWTVQLKKGVVGVALGSNSIGRCTSPVSTTSVTGSVSVNLCEGTYIYEVGNRIGSLHAIVSSSTTLRVLAFSGRRNGETFGRATSRVVTRTIGELCPGIGLAVNPTVRSNFCCSFSARAPFNPRSLTGVRTRVGGVIGRNFTLRGFRLTPSRTVGLVRRGSRPCGIRLVGRRTNGNRRVDFCGRNRFARLYTNPRLVSIGPIGTFGLAGYANTC